jgi:hypothetical protein
VEPPQLLFLGQFLILQQAEKVVMGGQLPPVDLVEELANLAMRQGLEELEPQVAKVAVDQEIVLVALQMQEELQICILVRTALMDLQQQLLIHQECDTAAAVVVALVQTQKTLFNLVLVAVRLVALVVAVAARTINLQLVIQTLT